LGYDRGVGRFIARRVVQAVPVLLGTTFFVFALVFALPGDPIAALYGDRPISPSVAAELRSRYHLDESLPAQYGHYMSALVHGNFGEDFSGRPVTELLQGRWSVTIALVLTAFVMQTVLGLALGSIAALRKGRAADIAVLVGTTALLSVPLFVVAFALQIIVGVELGWLPIANATEGWPRAYILPALVIALIGLAPVARLTRTSLIENQRAEYVRTARSKGLSGWRVFTRHTLRNSLIPVVTYLGADLGLMLGGTVVVETIFNLPGVGQLLTLSIRNQEGAVVVGVATLLVLAFLAINLAVDLLYGVLDPRVRHGRA
jgi:peptide/nickel transport system permease protein/oligopeptide transport system permease protein